MGKLIKPSPNMERAWGKNMKKSSFTLAQDSYQIDHQKIKTNKKYIANRNNYLLLKKINRWILFFSSKRAYC